MSQKFVNTVLVGKVLYFLFVIHPVFIVWQERENILPIVSGFLTRLQCLLVISLFIFTNKFQIRFINILDTGHVTCRL